MSLDILLDLLRWAAPMGLGGTVVWLVSRDVRRASAARQVHDTYKQMYEDVSQTLTELRTDYDRIYTICTRMERALSRASVCRYWPQCPIRDELPDGTPGKPQRVVGRQYARHERRGHADRRDAEGDAGHADDADPDVCPARAAPGR